MNPLQPSRFYVGVLSLALAGLAGGVLYFLAGMAGTTYLVTDGAHVVSHYMDKPRYDMHLQGLIFALAFLIAGCLLLLMVLLPDRNGRGRWTYDEEPTQPRRRQPPAPPPQPAPQFARAAPPPVAQHAPQPVAQAAPAPALMQAPPAAGPSPAHQSSPLSIEGAEGDAELAAPPPPPPPPPEPEPEPEVPGVSVEEEVLQSASDDLPSLDVEETRYEDTGEEDVVYGSGRITEDAAWEFVQTYPDSAVKFLYRKSLDNKQLTPQEADIYRGWELRGLTRAKTREIVLEIMAWQSLPDNFPHEIWRQLRDQIYEMKSR